MKYGDLLVFLHVFFGVARGFELGKILKIVAKNGTLRIHTYANTCSKLFGDFGNLKLAEFQRFPQKMVSLCLTSSKSTQF